MRAQAIVLIALVNRVDQTRSWHTSMPGDLDFLSFQVQHQIALASLVTFALKILTSGRSP